MTSFFFFCNKIYNHFSLVNPFSYSFVNSDWRELEIYFYTNEQDVKQNAFIVNFSDNSSHRRPSALSQCTCAKRLVHLPLSVSLRTVLRSYEIRASCLLQRFFRLRKELLFLHACSVTIGLKKSVKTLIQWSNFFRRL